MFGNTNKSTPGSLFGNTSSFGTGTTNNSGINDHSVRSTRMFHSPLLVLIMPVGSLFGGTKTTGFGQTGGSLFGNTGASTSGSLFGNTNKTGFGNTTLGGSTGFGNTTGFGESNIGVACELVSV